MNNVPWHHYLTYPYEFTMSYLDMVMWHKKTGEIFK